MAAKPDLAVRANRWVLNLSRHYLRWVLLLIGIYVGLPFLAPTLMHFGLTLPANVIYTAYSPLCHQFAFRSWFLFGEQPAYPRTQANVPGLKPLEAYQSEVSAAYGHSVDLSQWSVDTELAARNFLGTPRMGYKVALCERDIAIYGALFTCGVIYAIPYVRRRLRGVPLWLYAFLGLGPIGLDGFSQLLGYPPFSLWPARETTPFFRTLTGITFGLMNAWLAFPYLEASARDTVKAIEEKFARREERIAALARQDNVSSD